MLFTNTMERIQLLVERKLMRTLYVLPSRQSPALYASYHSHQHRHRRHVAVVNVYSVGITLGTASDTCHRSELTISKVCH
jgi:hypothetical protein